MFSADVFLAKEVSRPKNGPVPSRPRERLRPAKHDILAEKWTGPQSVRAASVQRHKLGVGHFAAVHPAVMHAETAKV